jgi:hypothetical protein
MLSIVVRYVYASRPIQQRNGDLGEVECQWSPFTPSSGRLPQYSSCSRTQFMVPLASLRPLGARSSQLNAPISNSVPR